MKLLLPFAMIAAVWTVCGIGEKTESLPNDKPATNVAVKQAPDRNEVRKELVAIANDIATAVKDGDVTFLAKITSDDLKVTGIDGKTRNKNQILSEVKAERTIKSFDIVDDKLVSLDDTSAVLTYTLKVVGKNGRTVNFTTTDTFVKEDGKWLIENEQMTLMR